MVNFPLISVPIAAALAYIPHVVRAILHMKHGGLDNTAPRELLEKKKGTLPKNVEDTIKKCGSAHNNQLEMLGLYAAGVAAATAAGIPHEQLTHFCRTYIASRACYNVAYMTEPPSTKGRIRSLTWLVALTSVIRLWVAAARKN